MSNETAQRTSTRTALFLVEKETKNTVKFEEVPARGQMKLSGSLYLQNTVEQQMADELGVEALYGLEVTIRGIPAPADSATA